MWRDVPQHVLMLADGVKSNNKVVTGALNGFCSEPVIKAARVLCNEWCSHCDGRK